MAKARAQSRKNSKDQSLVNIYLNVQHGKKSNYRKTGIIMPAAMWDKSARRAKRSYKDYKLVKDRLDFLEDRWYRIYVELGGDIVDVSFQDILSVWDKTYLDNNVDGSVAVDVGRNPVVVLNDYVSNMKGPGSNKGKKVIMQNEILLRNLRGYVKQLVYPLTLEKLNEKIEFLKFGHWMETERMIINDGVERICKPYNDSTIVAHMVSLNAFFNYRIEDKQDLLRYFRTKMIKSEWPKKNEYYGGIKGDLFDAVMETKINYDEHPNLRIYLDNLKIILGHGFRYSDLWMLTMESLKTDDDGHKSIKYVAPKTAKKSGKEIDVPLYPGAQEIIDFYKDKEIESILLDDANSPQAFKDKSFAPHLESKKTFGISRSKEHNVLINKNPLIPISSRNNMSWNKKNLYTIIQETWLKNQFGSEWESHKDEDIGFMKIITTERNRVLKKRILYETLAFHFARHTFCSRLANNPDIPMTVVRDTMGHGSITMVNKYLHTDNEENKRLIREVYRKAMLDKTN